MPGSVEGDAPDEEARYQAWLAPPGRSDAEVAERARRGREAVSAIQGVVDADLRVLSRALTRGDIDPSGLAPLFPTVEPRVYYLPSPSNDAYAQWQLMRDRVDDTGFWPLVLGDAEDVEIHAIQSDRWLATTPTAEESLVEAAAVEPEAWLAARTATRAAWYAERHRQLHRPSPGLGDLYSHGPWPEGTAPLQELHAHDGEVVNLGFFPTTRTWEVPAYLRWFVGNADLRPADHVRLHRRWAELYGAELVNVQDLAVAQFRVAKPPKDRHGALRLAVEHFEYCQDRVDQSAGTLEALAAQLLEAPVWYFWWD